MNPAELEKLKEVTCKNYADQGKYFLNAFWAELSAEAENAWKWANKFAELDLEKKKNGADLDEFNAHRFLEQIGETKRVVELRETLRTIDKDSNKRMALVEYLLYRYKKSITELLARPQGDPTEILKAGAKVQAAQDALSSLTRQLEEQKVVEADAKKYAEAAKKAKADAEKKADEARRTADLAKKAADQAKRTSEVATITLADQKKAEETVKAAEADLRAAVDELKAQEDANQKKLKDLETKSNDQAATVVVRNKAANELAQAKLEDPLPLRKAKITQEAALRKVERDRKAAEAATGKAHQAATAAAEAAIAADKASNAAEVAREQAEMAADTANAVAGESERAAKAAEEKLKKVSQAVAETEQALQEAITVLAEVKKRAVQLGSVWWLERDLQEVQKYLPKSKQRS